MSNCCIKDHDYTLDTETVSYPTTPYRTYNNKALNATTNIFLLILSELSDLKRHVNLLDGGNWSTKQITSSKTVANITNIELYIGAKYVYYICKYYPNQSYTNGWFQYWMNTMWIYSENNNVNRSDAWISSKANGFATMSNPLTESYADSNASYYSTKAELEAQLKVYRWINVYVPFSSNNVWKTEWEPIYEINPSIGPAAWIMPEIHDQTVYDYKVFPRAWMISYCWNAYITNKSYWNNDFERYKLYIISGFYRTLTPNFSTPLATPGWGLYVTDEPLARNEAQTWWNERPFELAYHSWLECPTWDPGTPEIPYRAAVPEIPYQPAVAEQLYVPGVPEQPYVAAVPEQPYVAAVPEQPYVPEQVIDCSALKIISTPPIMLAPPADNAVFILSPDSCPAKHQLYPWKDTILISIKCFEDTNLRITGVTNREYKIYDKTPFAQFQTYNPGAKHNHVHQKRLDLKKNQLLAARKLTFNRK